MSTTTPPFTTLRRLSQRRPAALPYDDLEVLMNNAALRPYRSRRDAKPSSSACALALSPAAHCRQPFLLTFQSGQGAPGTTVRAGRLFFSLGRQTGVRRHVRFRKSPKLSLHLIVSNCERCFCQGFRYGTNLPHHGPNRSSNS
jgi:hypothetical protein